MSDRPDQFCSKIDEALSELRIKFSDRADADECLDWELYFTLGKRHRYRMNEHAAD